MAVIIPTNKYQTPITSELLERYPKEVQEQFLDFIDTVPLLKWMISENRPRAKDLKRDDDGKIIVDVTHPHILENMDYFRPAAKFFQENGCYTFLKPNSNPNSEYGKWLAEEARRSRYGYVRESDGEWVTGLMYWYLNYSPIMLNRLDEDTGVYVRTEELPDFWEGIYYRFHYIDQARHAGKHGMELAKRGCSKSYSIASSMSRNLILGERKPKPKEHQRLTSVLAAYTKEYLSDKDGTFTKFTPMIDYVAANTEFPRLMLKRSPSEMIWKMGYKNSNGNELGSLNSVMGLSVKDDEGKIRGKRGYIFYEEMGSFPTFKETWNNTRDSVKEGNRVFSEMYAVGTAGDNASDFSGVKTMLYNPKAFEILDLDNVYDKIGKGAKYFCYFFPAYISRAGCMDDDGNSDVVKALMEILMERYEVKKSGDPSTLLSRVAQQPITPEEAILKVRSNFFPVVMITERIRQIETNPHFYDKVYVGTLVEVNGNVEFRTTDDVPIREYPIRKSDANLHGALEIYKMPPKGDIPAERYVLGVDPIENDEDADSESLFSCIMFDLFTDEVVAEYTGRMPLNEDNCYMAYLMCRFYNAKCMPEANKKNIYAYFAKKHALYMLADCPEYLKERDMVKYSTAGSSAKGVQSLPAIIHFAQDLIKDWLMKEVVTMSEDENGELKEAKVPAVYLICGIAMLKEMASYGPGVNTDRVSALMQVMLYRHQYQILYGEHGEFSSKTGSEASDDDFFNKDWNRAKKMIKV